MGDGAGGVEGEGAMVGVVLGLQSDLEMVRREEVGDALGPFDDDEAVGMEEVIEADGGEIFGGGDAIGIEMVDGFGAGVDVEEDIGGRADEVGVINGGTESDAAGEVGFACAEVSAEGEESARGSEASEE